MVKLGQRLYKIRTQRKQTLEEIAAEIKIKPIFLAAIEKGEYNKLPSPAYAQGFVHNYASYLGLSKAEINALFKREFDQKKEMQVLPRSMMKEREFPIKRVRIQQSIIAFIILLVLFVGYIVFQYRGALLSPSLRIDSPKEASVTSEEVVVKGKTEANATLEINGEIVSVNQDGSFQKALHLFPGEETIAIKAKNKFGKETSLERSIQIKE